MQNKLVLKMTSMTKGIDLFCAHLTACQKATGTIKAYKRDLRSVAKVLSQQGQDQPIEQISTTNLIEVLTNKEITHTPNGPKSDASIHRLKASIRSFFNWAENSDLINKNPARTIKLKRLNQKPPQFLTLSEKRTLLKELKGRHTYNDVRDRMILELLLGTGIRIGELHSINIDDIDLMTKHLRLKTKGGFYQPKFLNTRLRNLLSKYLVLRKKIANQSEQALFLSNQGTRLSLRQISNRFSHWIKKAGINKPLTPHKLRHTFATHLYAKTEDIFLIKKAMGHKDIASTMIYTHLIDNRLEDALEDL